jgi:hypothetical protein
MCPKFSFQRGYVGLYITWYVSQKISANDELMLLAVNTYLKVLDDDSAHSESVLFQLLDLEQWAGLPWTSDQLVARPLLTAPGDCDDREVGGMNGFGRGDRSTRRKPAPTPQCPPQIPLARLGCETGPPRWEASD